MQSFINIETCWKKYKFENPSLFKNCNNYIFLKCLLLINPCKTWYTFLFQWKWANYTGNTLDEVLVTTDVHIRVKNFNPVWPPGM